MTERRKQIRYNIAAFLLLFFVSLYRQLSLRFLPNDPFRTYILYACYVFLIGVWAASIPARVTQRNMRIFMLMQAGIILFGATVRFLQDTFWTDNIYLTRISGLWLSASLLPLLLCGLYASLGIGQADSYSIPRKWYLLVIPTLAMVLLNVTDEHHHFMFFLVGNEPQPNLEFYPNIGTYLMAALAFVIITVRILNIYKKNRLLSNHKVRRVLVPLAEPIFIIFASFTYFVGTLQLIPALKGIEVLELYAKLYYSEIITWEFFVYMGLIPTNMDYQEIFEHATVSMQIVKKDGSRILSKNAEPVSQSTIEELEKKGHVHTADGKELYNHDFLDGKLLWSKDLSRLQSTIADLDRSADVLSEEGALLSEELKTRKQETALQSKRQIYDSLTDEVKQQLRMMNELTKKCISSSDSDHLLKYLYLLGTYVKRRCNLRLIQRETGDISTEDLYLSFRDMISALNMLGIRAQLNWQQISELPADLSIFLFDTLEQLIEHERFKLSTITVAVDNGQMSFDIEKENAMLPDELILAAKNIGFGVYSSEMPNGYIINIDLGGE